MKIFIVAGEASGDQLAARLVADLRRARPDMQIFGIGGEALAAQGMQSIFPMSDLSLMGIAEVLPKIPLLLKRLDDTVKAIYQIQPDVVLTVDVPDFSKRLARRLQPLRRAGKVRLVHYVAPTVWAWRPGRAKVMAKLFDHLLCLFPFEPPYFEAVGLPASFVGHPVATAPMHGDAARLREKLGIRADQPVVCLLPGSRRGEVQKLLPVFLDAFDLLKQKQPDLVVVLPTLDSLIPILSSSGLPKAEPGDGSLYVLTSEQDKHDAFALAAQQGGAIAASGTVSLELAAAGCPHIVAYQVHPLTEWLVRRLYRLPHVNLMNIMSGAEVVPEILQKDVMAANLAEKWQLLMCDPKRQKTTFSDNLMKLSQPYQYFDKILGLI